MSSESVAEVMDVIFNKHGGPSAYIRGEEAGGAFVLGARYGRGELLCRRAHRTCLLACLDDWPRLWR